MVLECGISCKNNDRVDGNVPIKGDLTSMLETFKMRTRLPKHPLSAGTSASCEKYNYLLVKRSISGFVETAFNSQPTPLLPAAL